MSFVREEITSKLLNSVNMKVEGPLPSFIQNYLSFKYNFTPPPSNKRIDPYRIIHLDGFALYMLECNCLLNVEGLEFDYSCFILSQDHLDDVVEYSIPGSDGNDYIVRKSNYFDFHFTKTPFFMINNIVHPETYDTKTLYLSGLYEIFTNPSFDKNLMPFGEGVIEFFSECRLRNLPFKDVVSKLILSQFPSFNDYFEAILPFIVKYANITQEYTSILPNKRNEFFYPESKSSVLLNVNVPAIQAENYVFSEYDEKLMKKYEENLNSLLPFETPVYSYPLYSPLDKKVVYYGNSALNYELYIKILSRVKEGDNSTLERIYKFKKSVAHYLKGHYFAYHMQHSIYANLYPVSPFPSPPKSQEIPQYYPTWTLGQIKSIKNKEDLFKVIIKTVWHNNKFMANKLEKDLKTLINPVLGAGNDNVINDFQFYNKITQLYKNNK
jgi:hypothetical protein